MYMPYKINTVEPLVRGKKLLPCKILNIIFVFITSIKGTGTVF